VSSVLSSASGWLKSGHLSYLPIKNSEVPFPVLCCF
jgi:hypothetical protein